MATIVTVKNGFFAVQEDSRDIAIAVDDDQFTLDGIACPDAEIINYANKFLPAPYNGHGDYNGWEVQRDSSCIAFRVVVSDGMTILDIISDTADYEAISEEEANARYQSGNWPLNAWCVPPEIEEKIDEIGDPEDAENFEILDKKAIWTAYYEPLYLDDYDE